MAVTINGTTGIVTPALDNNGNLDVDGGTIKLDGNYPVGTSNVALGDTAFDGNSTGAYNVAVGDGALSATGSPNFSTAVGFYALNANTANSNTAIGRGSLQANTTPENNTAVGAMSLNANTTGADNTSVGKDSTGNNTAGTSLSALGKNALRKNTTGNFNTAVGHSALNENTTASYQTSLGYQAGFSRTANSYNTDVGALAGYTSTGQLNTFIGQQAGYSMTTGDGNTIIGRYNGNMNGLDIRTSNNNIVLSDGGGNPRLNFRSDAKGRFGDQPSYDINQNLSGLGNVMMGQFGGSFGDNLLITNVGAYTGQYDHWKLYNGNGLVGRVYTSGSSTVYSTSSDYRLKENVVNIDGAIDRVKQLNPSRYNFIADPNVTLDGFLAHEVQEIVPEAVCGEKDAVDENGDIVPQGIDQSKLVPLLTAALKEAITEIESLKARVTALESN